MAVLPASMSRLVLIHEIHIDGVIGNLTVKLSVQMAQRFSVFLKPEDPALGR